MLAVVFSTVQKPVFQLGLDFLEGVLLLLIWFLQLEVYQHRAWISLDVQLTGPKLAVSRVAMMFWYVIFEVSCVYNVDKY